jgi:Protein of unknown function (DUF3892)
MADWQISCINKPHHLSPHEHITHIGNSEGNWRLTLTGAIGRFNSGQDTFYTVDLETGMHVAIGVVSAVGLQHAYLKTHADGKWNDNLLAQQECGAKCRIII